MTAHFDLRSYIDSRGIPTFVVVDVQQEYIAAPRALALPHIVSALDNCRIAIAHARSLGLPVAFVRWLGQSSAYFNAATPFTDWIEGFTPQKCDMVFERSKPSCYASAHFSSVLEQAGGHFVLAGFAGEAACLSTAVDAFHRGHTMLFLEDASSSHPLRKLDAAQTHRAASQFISLYANVTDTASWVTQAANDRNRGGGPHGSDIRKPA